MHEPVSLRDFILHVWANHLNVSYTSDPYYITKKWKVDPLPHQVELVAHAMKLDSLRMLIADEVGLGKTIMAGMILKELIERDRLRRVLIAAPAGLIGQWKGELMNKFGLEFTTIGKEELETNFLPDQAIISIDTGKINERPQIISAKPWDLAIFDEAHKLSIRQDFDETRETERYRFAKMVCSSAKNVLLLSATPHNGDSLDFEFRLRLLDPEISCGGRPDLLNTYVQRFMVRRLKEEVRGPSGESIFPPRTVAKLEVDPTSEELEFYHTVEEYIKSYYRKAGENRTIQLALIILLRRVSSSIRAGVISLNRRRQKIQALRARKAGRQVDTPLNEEIFDTTRDQEFQYDLQNILETIEESPEKDTIEEEIKVITPSLTIEQLDEELLELDKLIGIGEYLISKNIESKAARLAELVNQLVNTENRKVIIFTEYKDTLQYLVDILGSYPIVTIHGDRNKEQRESAAEALFSNKAQILIATDAAGEGLNLQAASAVINYELPWNPNKLDQRLGRVHRYKQDTPVIMYNVMLRETVEGKVVEKLMTKLEEIKRTMGGENGDKVYDIVGTLADSDLIRQVTTKLLQGWSADSVDGILDVMQQRAKDIMQAERLLTSKYIGAVENREKPPSAISFMLAWAARRGYDYSLDRDSITVRIGPTQYQKLGEQESWNSRGLRTALEEYTNNSDTVISHAKGCFAKAVVVYKISVSNQYDNNLDSRIVALAVKGTGAVEEIPLSTIYNISEGVDPMRVTQVSIEKAILDRSMQTVTEITSSMANDIGAILRDEINFKLESVEAEFERKLQDLEKLMPHIREVTREQITRDYRCRMKDLETKAIVKIGSPQVLGVLLLECDDHSREVNKKNVEMAGMNAVMMSEKENNRDPKDISMYNLGYDIRSIGIGEVRHIEVKSFSKSGTVEITDPEWRKACEEQDKYWLYVVEDALDNPKIHRIQNPCKNLSVWEELREKIVMERRYLSNTWQYFSR